MVIGTLNYDNSIELLAQSHGLPCNTGIQDWSETGSINVTSNGLHLLKLHGSVDWQRYRQEISDAKPMPTSAFRVLDKDVLPNMSEQHYPEVVFGGRNKLTAGGPYLDLFQAFKKELDQVEILTIVGYSFRDVHINTCITNWLNQGADHRIRIIRRNFDTDMGLYPDMLRRHASERLDVVKASAGEGLSFLYPDIA